MGRSTTKEWKQLKARKEAEIAASVAESRRKAAYRQQQIDRRKAQAGSAIEHGEGEDHNAASISPQPGTVATRRDTEWRPLDPTRLPIATGIDGRTRWETTGNAPGMGTPVPSAVDQAIVAGWLGPHSGSALADSPRQATPPLTFADQFTVPSTPKRRETRTTAYERSRDVRHEVMNRAGGVCELCGLQGFKTESKALYLETHHVVPLAEGGADAVWNVVAICPNDHRRAHFAYDRLALRESMILRLITMYPSAANPLRILMKR